MLFRSNTSALVPGLYKDGITFTSNAAAYAGALGDSSSLTVPVELEVVAAGPPVIDFQGVQDNATFVPGDPLAPGDIAVVKGQQLSTKDFVQAGAPPIPTQLSDTQVLFNGQPLPLYYTLYGQIACQIPSDAPLGTSIVQVKRQDGQVSNLVSVDIAARAPRILVGPGGYGVITNQDGSRPMPNGSWPGVPTHPAKIGDTLTLWAIGLGATSPICGDRPTRTLQRTAGPAYVHACGRVWRRHRRRHRHAAVRRSQPDLRGPVPGKRDHPRQRAQRQHLREPGVRQFDQ